MAVDFGFDLAKKEGIMNLNPYRKTITAVVTGLIGWSAAITTSDSSSITAAEWVMLATILATSFGVYQIANKE